MDISSYSVDYYYHVVAEIHCIVLLLLCFITIILPFIIHVKRQDIVCVQIKKDNCATACLTKTMESHIDVDIIKSELKKQVHELNHRRVVMKSQHFAEAGNRLKVRTDQPNLRKIWTECK